jgi:hypothetical protein
MRLVFFHTQQFYFILFYFILFYFISRLSSLETQPFLGPRPGGSQLSLPPFAKAKGDNVPERTLLFLGQR